MFRFYFVIALISIALWWPLNYLLGFLLFKRRVSRVAKNMQIVDDYPLLGSALRFMGKNNEGSDFGFFFVFQSKLLNFGTNYTELIQNIRS